MRREHRETVSARVAYQIAADGRSRSPLGAFMQSFDEIPTLTTRGRQIRWPFRLLAAVMVLAALIGILGGAYSVLGHGGPRAALMLLAAAPVAALTARLCGYAALKGRAIGNPNWPFASGSVALSWLVAAWIIVSYT